MAKRLPYPKINRIGIYLGLILFVCSFVPSSSKLEDKLYFSNQHLWENSPALKTYHLRINDVFRRPLIVSLDEAINEVEAWNYLGKLRYVDDSFADVKIYVNMLQVIEGVKSISPNSRSMKVYHPLTRKPAYQTIPILILPYVAEYEVIALDKNNKIIVDTVFIGKGELQYPVEIGKLEFFKSGSVVENYKLDEKRPEFVFEKANAYAKDMSWRYLQKRLKHLVLPQKGSIRIQTISNEKVPAWENSLDSVRSAISEIVLAKNRNIQGSEQVVLTQASLAQSILERLLFQSNELTKMESDEANELRIRMLQSLYKIRFLGEDKSWCHQFKLSCLVLANDVEQPGLIRLNKNYRRQLAYLKSYQLFNLFEKCSELDDCI